LTSFTEGSIDVAIVREFYANLYEPKDKFRNPPFGGRATRGLTGASSKKRKCAKSPPTFIRGKRRKNWEGVVYEL